MSSSDKKDDYSKTLNLPQTGFPMRGNLPEREPYFLKRMQENKVYQKTLEKNKANDKFVLHDGPPYANGNIHMGHALNKVLKDIVIRYKALNGFYTPYVPGWDTHGLPIEKKVQQEKKITREELGIAKFRDICKDYALKAVKNQAEQFKRLGGFGDYDNNKYLTLDPEFEANEIQVFWDMYKKGYIYRDLKPVYWCSDCETALAEAELEYSNDEANTIYVKFKIKEDNGKLTNYGGYKDTYILIWTTTPWTIPSNKAITVNKDFNYAIVEVDLKDRIEKYILAEKLVDKVMSDAFIADYKVIGLIKGSELKNMICYEPLNENETSRVLLGSDKDLDVSLDTGTGCVHTAPGHGLEDFMVCKRYGGIDVVVGVDKHGKMTKETGKYEGMHFSKANDEVIKDLKAANMLFATKKMLHQYPHCWRCKKPVIFRATTQWFASVKGFSKETLEQVNTVRWVPEWGNERMSNMIKDRQDWCISSQRVWGVPIPIFYCKDCGKPIINEQTIEIIKKKVKVNGSGMWFELTPEQILQGAVKCDNCGGSNFEKENDIMDVWFDSGSTYATVLKDKKYGIGVEQADMYLEGNDQYRGWFQSSLLTSVATRGIAPYKQVLTHGWVVDGDGRKMSKSLGNGIDPLEVIKTYGADILRLWTVSADYHGEMRISKDILNQVAEVYKKIRNTIRFLLGNLSDFSPVNNMVEFEKREELDRYIMLKLNNLIKYIGIQYEAYDFHQVYSELHRFCTVDLSNNYLDIIKDILYTYPANSKIRRSAQSTMYDILKVLVKLIAPIIPYTADEIWSYIWHMPGESELSVMLSDFPEFDSKYVDRNLAEKWDKIFKIKDELAKDLEAARAAKRIGHSLDARVTMYASEEEFEFLKQNEENLKFVTIVSQFEVEKAEKPEDVTVMIEKAYGDKCARCWMYSQSVGRNLKHEDLCDKCVKNLGL